MDSETLHRDSSRCFGDTFGGLCARYCVVLDRRLDCFLAWGISDVYYKIRRLVKRILTASRYETVLGIMQSFRGILGRNRSSLVTSR